MAAADFSGAVLTGVFFTTLCECAFSYTLVKNDFTLVDLIHADFCHTQKRMSQGPGLIHIEVLAYKNFQIGGDL